MKLKKICPAYFFLLLYVRKIVSTISFEEPELCPEHDKMRGVIFTNIGYKDSNKSQQHEFYPIHQMLENTAEIQTNSYSGGYESFNMIPILLTAEYKAKEKVNSSYQIDSLQIYKPEVFIVNEATIKNEFSGNAFTEIIKQRNHDTELGDSDDENSDIFYDCEPEGWDTKSEEFKKRMSMISVKNPAFISEKAECLSSAKNNKVVLLRENIESTKPAVVKKIGYICGDSKLTINPTRKIDIPANNEKDEIIVSPCAEKKAYLCGHYEFSTYSNLQNDSSLRMVENEKKELNKYSYAYAESDSSEIHECTTDILYQRYPSESEKREEIQASVVVCGNNTTEDSQKFVCVQQGESTGALTETSNFNQSKDNRKKPFRNIDIKSNPDLSKLDSKSKILTFSLPNITDLNNVHTQAKPNNIITTRKLIDQNPRFVTRLNDFSDESLSGIKLCPAASCEQPVLTKKESFKVKFLGFFCIKTNKKTKNDNNHRKNQIKINKINA